MSFDGQSEFDSFLLFLDADREQAALRYERIRNALIRFFSANGSRDPETRADDVLDIFIVQVSHGRKVENAESWAVGIARNILLKELGRRRIESQLSESGGKDSKDAAIPDESDEQTLRDKTLECQRSCVAKLPSEDRRLLVRYHNKGGNDRKGREELAADMHLSPGALRVKIHRIKNKLRKCVRKCLRKQL